MITFLTQLGAHLGLWLYVLAAGLAFGESALLIGMVLPGETALLIAGYFSHQGILNLPIMLVLATLLASRSAADTAPSCAAPGPGVGSAPPGGAPWMHFCAGMAARPSSSLG